MALKHNKATFLVVSLAMIAALLEGSTVQSAVHVVGGDSGWFVPKSDAATVYSNWAANNAFKVNDVLEFNFASGIHDVAEVTKEVFDACNTTSPISKETKTPANITLTSAGEHYYICTFPDHCAGGQKLAINVITSDTATPPPPGNSAKSLGVALSSTFLTILVALLY